MAENLFFDPTQLKHCGKNVIIGKTVRIRHPEKVSIGDNVIIDDFCYITGEVEIGDYVHIGNGCTISASANKITFGPFCGVAAGTKIYGASSNYIKCALDLPTIPKDYVYDTIRGDVVCERFVLLGANCVVTPGVHIPEGCAFSAGLLVGKSMRLKPWSLICDNQGSLIPRSGVKSLLERVEQFYTFE